MDKTLIDYQGSCHCGAVKFAFKASKITEGLKCNCSICRRKNAIMSGDAFSSTELARTIQDDALATYEFGTGVAQHHFCKHCGIYTFHQTMRKPGHYRINLACVEGIDTEIFSYTIFDGASL